MRALKTHLLSVNPAVGPYFAKLQGPVRQHGSPAWLYQCVVTFSGQLWNAVRAGLKKHSVLIFFIAAQVTTNLVP